MHRSARRECRTRVALELSVKEAEVLFVQDWEGPSLDGEEDSEKLKRRLFGGQPSNEGKVSVYVSDVGKLFFRWVGRKIL